MATVRFQEPDLCASNPSDIIDSINHETEPLLQGNHDNQQDESSSSDIDNDNPSDNTEQDHPPIPKIIFVLLMFAFAIHSFVFYSVLWRLVSYANYAFKADKYKATIYVQVFLLVNYFSHIISGIVGDVLVKRFYIVIISSAGLAICSLSEYLLDLVISTLDEDNRRVAYIILIILFAFLFGLSKSAMLMVGIDQLSNETDLIARTSLIRWYIWSHEMGRYCAFAIVVTQFDAGEFPARSKVGLYVELVCTLLNFLCVCIFVIIKPWCRLNNLNGSKTFIHLKFAVKEAGGYQDWDDDEWSIHIPSPPSKEMKDWRLGLLRRFSLLILIFIMFGTYDASYFLAKIVYPIQYQLQMGTTEKGLNMIGNMIGFSTGSLIILILIPIIDLCMRKVSCCTRNRTNANFVLVCFGMGFAVMSLISAQIVFSVYGITNQKKKILNLAFQPQYLFYSLGELCFYTGGYDMAFAEGPPYLKGTTMGLYNGLGSLFGALIYFGHYLILQLTKKNDSLDSHITLTIPYTFVICSTVVTIGFYIVLVRRYKKARSKYRICREKLRNLRPHNDFDYTVSYQSLRE